MQRGMTAGGNRADAQGQRLDGTSSTRSSAVPENGPGPALVTSAVTSRGKPGVTRDREADKRPTDGFGPLEG